MSKESSYEESQAALYDPIKPRVMGALTRALTQSDLHDLKVVNDGATKLSNSELYPYEPDFLVGHNGKKLGIFVLNDINVMRDSSKPDGETQRKMDLLEQYHKQG